MSAGGGGGGKKKKPMKKMAHVGPNMTPMVDVVMCILIFFMLGSSFVMPEVFLKSSMPAIDKAGLGENAAEGKMPAVKLWIKMAREGDDTIVRAFDAAPQKMDKVKNDADPATADQTTNENILKYFKAKQAGLSPDVQIIIKPDGKVPYQDVITIYDYCMEAQFKQVAFAPAG
ncbi:MAG: biopolymer transporter ExbD [Phycisphaerales bacterium]|nr:biopolymer transporter ExbD [Phycisphaerales bacterium]